MFSICDSIQEELAWGRALTATQIAHTASCKTCGALKSQMVELDEVFLGQLAIRVPDGFVDRVMASLPPVVVAGETRLGMATRLMGLLERRSVQIALAHAGLGFTIANLFRFVFSILVPATSLGAGR